MKMEIYFFHQTLDPVKVCQKINFHIDTACTIYAIKIGNIEKIQRCDYIFPQQCMILVIF